MFDGDGSPWAQSFYGIDECNDLFGMIRARGSSCGHTHYGESPGRQMLG